MINLRSEKNGSQAHNGRLSERVARVIGRLVLWGCVVLLLIHGVLSYFNTEPHSLPTAHGVTVTQPGSPARTPGK
jgi:hypothetical protein